MRGGRENPEEDADGMSERYPVIDIGKYSKEEWRERVRETAPWVPDDLFEKFWQELLEEKQKKAV